MATVKSGRAKYVRKKPQMIENYKRIMRPEKKEDWKKGVAKFLGVAPEKINPAPAKNFAAAIPSMKEAYEAVMKTTIPEEKWESRLMEKLTIAV